MRPTGLKEWAKMEKDRYNLMGENLMWAASWFSEKFSYDAEAVKVDQEVDVYLYTDGYGEISASVVPHYSFKFSHESLTSVRRILGISEAVREFSKSIGEFRYVANVLVPGLIKPVKITIGTVESPVNCKVTRVEKTVTYCEYASDCKPIEEDGNVPRVEASVVRQDGSSQG